MLIISYTGQRMEDLAANSSKINSKKVWIPREDMKLNGTESNNTTTKSKFQFHTSQNFLNFFNNLRHFLMVIYF